jgi:hypothetical protein
MLMFTIGAHATRHYELASHVSSCKKIPLLARCSPSGRGPATNEEVKSPYSYIVEYNGHLYKLHTNMLRPFRVRAEEAVCQTVLHATPESPCNSANVFNCTMVFEHDTDFGNISPVATDMFARDESLPSSRISQEALSHLND